MNYLTVIKKAISESSLYKKDIARALNLKYDTFRRKLNGESDFKVNELIALCKLINLNILEVFKNEQESNIQGNNTPMEWNSSCQER